MDLVCGTPLWPTLDGLPAAYPALHRDLRCDVAVIGGGITGALVAHRFAAEGISTVLLEAEEIGRGSTSATTALIQYEIDTHLSDLIPRIGREPAVRSYRLCLDAVAGIGRLARTLDPKAGCAWRTASSLYLASHRKDVPGLEAEHAARRAIGIEVELLTERDLRQRFSFTRPAALRSALAGELDAFKLTYLLLADGAERGLAVYDRTRVVRYDPMRGGVRLGTEQGDTVRARRVVFATGYETPEFLDRTVVRLHDTYALATAPVDRFEGWGDDRCLIWETARPYFYARTTGDGRVMMGGADRPFAGGSRPSSGGSSRRSGSTPTGAGAGPSATPRTGSPTSARCGSSPTGTSRWGTGATGSPSPGSPPTSCSTGSWTGGTRTSRSSASTGSRPPDLCPREPSSRAFPGMVRYSATALLASLGFAAGVSGRAGPEPAPSPRFSDVTLATGVRLRYAEQGDAGGPAVILLHGFSDSWFSWSRVLPLIPSRYHVIAPDSRGHGDSDKPEGGYAMRDLAGDVLALMDALHLERATIVGHSMGSVVAQQVAVAAPDRVERLVLVGSGPSFQSMSGVNEFAAAVYALEDPVPEQFAREFQVSTIYQPIPAAFLDTAVATSLRLPARVWHGIMTGMLDTPVAPELAGLGIPTLIVWGDRDAVFGPAAQQALIAQLPKARSSIYPETGHAPHWERPERFAGDLVRFLGAIR